MVEEAVPQASVTVTVYVVVPTGGFKVADKPLVLTTGPPVQTAVNGVEPFCVFTVNTVFGVALQYVVVPVTPVTIIGVAILTETVDDVEQPTKSVAVMV